MATRQYQLHDLLGKAGDASAWSEGKFTCAACRRRYAAQKFDTSVGSICVSCVEKTIKKISKSEDLLFWEISRMLTALSDNGPMDDRLTVLWKCHDALRYVNAKGPSKLPKFHQSLVKNLGYVQPHPLSQAVRQAAYQACVTIGKPLVPILLEMCAMTPWQFYANIIMVLGTVAPEHGEVQALLHRAVHDSNSEISTRAQTALENLPATFGNKQDMLQKVLKTLPPELRQFVHIGAQKSKDSHQGAQRTSTGTPEYLPGQKQIEDLLSAKYSADALKKIYKTYLQDFITTDVFPDADKPLNKVKKQSLAWLLARVYVDTSLLEQFHARMSDEVKDMLKQLVWEGGEIDALLMEKLYQVEMVKPMDRFRYGGSVAQDIHDVYAIFLVRRQYQHHYYYGSKENPYQYFFWLPDEVRTLLKDYLPRPTEYDLIPLEKIEETQSLYVDEDRIIQQLPLFYSYIGQGHLKFSKSTRKVLKTSIKQMAQYCHIREFYEDSNKNLAYMRTQLLIEFCRAVKITHTIDASPDSVRMLFKKFFTDTSYGRFLLSGLLWHLQGVHHVDYSNEGPETDVRNTLSMLLQSLPVQQWLSVEHLVHYCIYRDLSLEIIEKYSAGRYLFYKRDISTQNYSYDNKTYVATGIYKEALLIPFLKAAMFLLAAFGVVDLAYDTPKNEVLNQSGKPYLSEFDGLHYVRLTPLGAYVVGVTDTYEAAIEAEQANIILDEKRLFMTIEGRDRLKRLVIEKIAEKISETCYRVTYQSFLKECASKQDIENTIELFHTHISKKPPTIWQEFLDDVRAKINPLVPNQRLAVYKLTPNKELISLIARDAVLKKYLLKAEDYHIVIDARQLSKVKKRLEEFGYLIDNF